MPRVRSVEGKIEKLEGFGVRFRHAHDGRDVRSDKEDIPTFGYERAAKDDYSVSEWKKRRFAQKYPSYDVDVLKADGSVAHGATKLGSVRATYED